MAAAAEAAPPSPPPPPQQEPQGPILVIGAGELGTAVLEALAAHPKRDPARSPLAVLLRPSRIASSSSNPANERLRSIPGAAPLELVPGDVAADSEEDLARTFARYDTVVACAGMGAGFPPGTQLKLARAAALGARVRRYVPWQWGVDYDAVGRGSGQDLFDEQLAVRELLRGEGGSSSSSSSSSSGQDPGQTKAAATTTTTKKTDWVIVSVGLFMSFLFQPGFGAVDLGGRVARALGSWDTEVTVTAVRDIARVAAEVVCDPRGGETRCRVVLAGGDTVTYGRVAELVERRFPSSSSSSSGEKEWRREEWTLDFLRKKLEENPDDGMAKYRVVFGAGRGVAWSLDETINRRRGLEMTTVEEYLAEMEG